MKRIPLFLGPLALALVLGAGGPPAVEWLLDSVHSMH